jgi:hypothetical protein
MYTEPLRPPFANPLPISSVPVLPTVDVPVLNTKSPLPPEVPELAVDNNKLPLEVNPDPDTRIARPPTDDDLPAESTSSPPEPLLPDPTLT